MHTLKCFLWVYLFLHSYFFAPLENNVIMRNVGTHVIPISKRLRFVRTYDSVDGRPSFTSRVICSLLSLTAFVFGFSAVTKLTSLMFSILC
jgi:hypothetical protein